MLTAAVTLKLPLNRKRSKLPFSLGLIPHAAANVINP
jgi:hypothetical protein